MPSDLFDFAISVTTF